MRDFGCDQCTPDARGCRFCRTAPHAKPRKRAASTRPAPGHITHFTIYNPHPIWHSYHEADVAILRLLPAVRSITVLWSSATPSSNPPKTRDRLVDAFRIKLRLPQRASRATPLMCLCQKALTGSVKGLSDYIETSAGTFDTREQRFELIP